MAAFLRRFAVDGLYLPPPPRSGAPAASTVRQEASFNGLGPRTSLGDDRGCRFDNAGDVRGVGTGETFECFDCLIAERDGSALHEEEPTYITR